MPPARTPPPALPSPRDSAPDQALPDGASSRPGTPATTSSGTLLGSTERARDLLNAFIAISADLDLPSMLRRIVDSACELTTARYGALGVMGEDGSLTDFVSRGVTPELRDLLGGHPQGLGLIGELMVRPAPLRLARLQDHPSSVGFPPHHPPMTTFLGVPIRIRGSVFGNLYLTEKSQGAAFSEEDELLVSALATAAGFLIENAREFALSERRRQWLEASVRISETLQPPIQLPEALQQVAAAARLVTEADAVVIVQRLDSEHYRVTAGDGPQVHQGAELAARLETEILQCELSSTQQAVRDSGATVLLVPLKAQLSASGVLVALLGGGRASVEGEERELLTTFADQASMALDRARQQEEREELALVSDRDRIARDMHDLVIQQIFATGLQLQGVARLTAEQVVTERINQAVTDMDETIREIRASIFALQKRDRRSLLVAVRELVEEYVPVLGFAPALRTVGPVETLVSHDLAGHLLAVLREALSNVARHAHATAVTIDLQVVPGELVLRVADDGAGLPDQRDESGLRNVRHRAHELGGIVWLHPSHPRGTTMEWRVPLPPG